MIHTYRESEKVNTPLIRSVVFPITIVVLMSYVWMSEFGWVKVAVGAGVIGLLFAVKMVAKGIGVWPTAAAFHVPRRQRNYTTLLMSTGLTFGSISALYGLTHNLISQAQYSQLVSVVILSAFIPTLIAQRLFQPAVIDVEEEDALGAEDAGVVRRRSGATARPVADV